MIKSKEDLEAKVFDYAPELKERAERDSSFRSELESIADGEFRKYEPFTHGKSGALGNVGRGLGYVGDAVFWGSAIAAAINPVLAPYMLTGLLLKKINATAQIPEMIRTAKYAVKTGDVKGAVWNEAAKVISYAPGLTVVDRGLGKIAQKRMIKQAVYRAKKAAGEESEPWHTRYAAELEESGNYTDVKDREDNIIKVDFGERKLRKAA